MKKKHFVNYLDDIIWAIGGYKAHNFFVQILRFFRKVKC
jgi:hypothetical protein